MVKAKILLVEDDPNMAFLINENLQADSFNVIICHNGESALKIFDQDKFDLCILDIMLPQMDGFTLAKEIRKKNAQIPIIFLTARNMMKDKVIGFNLGGDDYITKPFNLQELLLRIEAILKRSKIPKTCKSFEERELGAYNFNYLMRQLKKGPEIHKLSTKEAELLNILLEHKNQLIHRQLILEHVWGEDNFFTAKSMDVYLSRIRKLIANDPYIELQNVHGVGYRLVVVQRE